MRARRSVRSRWRQPGLRPGQGPRVVGRASWAGPRWEGVGGGATVAAAAGLNATCTGEKGRRQAALNAGERTLRAMQLLQLSRLSRGPHCSHSALPTHWRVDAGNSLHLCATLHSFSPTNPACTACVAWHRMPQHAVILPSQLLPQPLPTPAKTAQSLPPQRAPGWHPTQRAPGSQRQPSWSPASASSDSAASSVS